MSAADDFQLIKEELESIASGLRRLLNSTTSLNGTVSQLSVVDASVGKVKVATARADQSDTGDCSDGGGSSCSVVSSGNCCGGRGERDEENVEGLGNEESSSIDEDKKDVAVDESASVDGAKAEAPLKEETEQMEKGSDEEIKVVEKSPEEALFEVTMNEASAAENSVVWEKEEERRPELKEAKDDDSNGVDELNESDEVNGNEVDEIFPGEFGDEIDDLQEKETIDEGVDQAESGAGAGDQAVAGDIGACENSGETSVQTAVPDRGDGHDETKDEIEESDEEEKVEEHGNGDEVSRIVHDVQENNVHADNLIENGNIEIGSHESGHGNIEICSQETENENIILDEEELEEFIPNVDHFHEDDDGEVFQPEKFSRNEKRGEKANAAQLIDSTVISVSYLLLAIYFLYFLYYLLFGWSDSVTRTPPHFEAAMEEWWKQVYDDDSEDDTGHLLKYF